MELKKCMYTKFNEQFIHKILLLRKLLLKNVEYVFPKELIYLIMNPVMENRCVLEIVMSRIILCKMFETMGPASEYCNVKINKNKLKISHVSICEKILSKAKFDVKKFDIFYCEKTGSHSDIIIGINMKKILHVLYSTKFSIVTMRLYKNNMSFLELDVDEMKINIELCNPVGLIPVGCNTAGCNPITVCSLKLSMDHKFIVDAQNFFSICMKMRYNRFIELVAHLSSCIPHSYIVRKYNIVRKNNELYLYHANTIDNLINYRKRFDPVNIIHLDKFRTVCDKMYIYLQNDNSLLFEFEIMDSNNENILGTFSVAITQ